MPWWAWLVAAAAFSAGLALLLVWLLVVTEGAYLGPGVVTALYDRYARRYDRIKQFDDDDEAHFLGEPVARYLAGLVTGPAGEPWMLDVAGGTGRLVLAVLRASEGRCRCVALDRSEGMLRQAQMKLSKAGWTDVIYLRHDAHPLPFADNQFDVVGCLEALEFMPDPRAALVELVRVARPGGLVLTTRRIGRDAKLMPGKVFSRTELAELLRSAGAGAVDIRPWQVDYDLAWALKAGPDDTGISGLPWDMLVRCPHHTGSVTSCLQIGGQELLACHQCHWRLALDNGMWRVVKRS